MHDKYEYSTCNIMDIVVYKPIKLKYVTYDIDLK